MTNHPIAEPIAHRLPTKKANIARRLDAAASSSLLHTAIAMQTPCSISRIDQLDRTPQASHIAKGNEQYLFLRGHDSQDRELQELANGVLRMVLNVGGMDYTFDVPNGCTWLASEHQLRIPSPRTLTLIERRRSPRRSFQQTSEVRLSFAAENSRKSCSAVLLNLSADGLACRAEHSDASELVVGRDMEADIQFDSEEQPIHLFGRIVSLTAGGSPGTVVVGLEFHDRRNPPLAKSRLRTLLGTTT